MSGDYGKNVTWHNKKAGRRLSPGVATEMQPSLLQLMSLQLKWVARNLATLP